MGFGLWDSSKAKEWQVMDSNRDEGDKGRLWALGFGLWAIGRE